VGTAHRKAERLLASLVVGDADPREVPASDAAALVILAVDHGLGTALLEAVRGTGLHPAGSPWAPLVDYDRWAAARYLASRAEQSRIEAALSSLGIEWVWLKGYALAHSVYPRPVLRPMLDLDLLVPAERCGEAERALRAVGYLSEDAPPMYPGVERSQHHLEHLRSPSGIILEVHMRLHPSERLLPIRELEWFRARTMETRAAGAAVKHFTPEAQLLHLCGHAMLQHGAGDLRLQRFYDCHLLIAQNPAFDWRALLDQAARLGWSYALDRMLTQTRDYFRTEVPGEVWQELRQAHPSRPAAWARKVAVSLEGKGAASAFARVRAFAPSPFFALYQGLRVLVPSAEYMRWRYGPKIRFMPIVYMRRWYEIARKLRKEDGSGA
jgi:hypothetical protein